MLKYLVLSVLGFGPIPELATDRVAIVQSVLRHPKIQLHYFDSYLKGNMKVEIVSKTLRLGSKLFLFEAEFRTVQKLSQKSLKTNNYIAIGSARIKGNRGYVYGRFPAQGVIIEAWPVNVHGRWIAAEEKIGISKESN